MNVEERIERDRFIRMCTDLPADVVETVVARSDELIQDPMEPSMPSVLISVRAFRTPFEGVVLARGNHI